MRLLIIKSSIMKAKSIWLWVLLVVTAVSSCKYDDGELWDKVNSLDNRVTNLEEQLTQMNTNISSISTIVNAIDDNLFITSLEETANGYSIKFSNGETATLTNGTDGAAGKDAPVIGFDEFEGKYYWTQTIDGQQSWLTDDAGNKLPVTGIDAVTPQLKVNTEGFWMVSYDNGLTYAEVLDEAGNPVKAVGEDGKDGEDGIDGSDGAKGDSWFSDVVYDEANGTLTITMLNGDVLTLSVVTTPDTGIPSDVIAAQNPAPQITGEPTITIPNISNFSVDANNSNIGTFSLLGIETPDNSWLELFGTGKPNQNVWLQIDGKEKGFEVINTKDLQTQNQSRSRAGSPIIARAQADVVFLVDNSGTMSQESNAVANQIIAWSQYLSQSMDVKFGCVGNAEAGNICGALNITDVNTLHEYLNANGTGARRTKHFGEYMSNVPADMADIKAKAQAYGPSGSGECGGIMLHFADEYFTFRPGSNRIYVHFTDEPNQPGGNSQWSVKTVDSTSDVYNWDASRGTIYTVFSGGTNHNWQDWYRNEDPCLFSTYTGGSYFETDGNFNIDLIKELPVSQAITNSFIFRFNITKDMTSGTYEVTIVIYDENGNIKATKTFSNISFAS